MRSPRSEYGFTFLELLIAFVIMSIIVLIVYMGLDAVSKGTDLARLSAEKSRVQRYLISYLSETLGSIYIDPLFRESAYRFVGTNESGPYGPADSLRFCTSLPMPGPYALPGVRRVVSMWLEENKGNSDSVSRFSVDIYGLSNNAPYYLVINETPVVLDEDSDFAGDLNNLPVNEVKVPLATLDIWYFDPLKMDWVEEWDSQSSQLMPWAVHIIGRLFNEYGEVETEKSEDLDLIVVLPVTAGTVQPMDDPNHFRDVGSLFRMDSNKVKGKEVNKGK
ncbi:MAG: prepilin-type N-terminal cleavage/methylation domain-containing protein [Candidatus Hydrogenedentes bacterium]|nr:prepilin-type N-terminal cleavage/methylation domain-containing protein [Candidatus Hydrogenedentota bacterium]